MTGRTRIKICGLTRVQDVEAAVQAGADAVGFVMYERSPRHVTPHQLGGLAGRLPPFVTPVLLFVNAAPALIQAAVGQVPQALLQFHGDESPAECDAAGRPYVRAARMRAGLDLVDFCSRFSNASAVLVDTDSSGYGGSGKVFDWSLLPPHVPCPLVLSGGLTPANVGEGMLTVRPWAVDVSSGVEQAPGIKDPELIRRFVQAVREADERLGPLRNTAS